MTRTDEAEWWFNAVYDAVQQIPSGKVTSYGHIARLLGYRKSRCIALRGATVDISRQAQRSRQVGVCLKYLPSNTDDVEHYYNNDNVPWQRVVNAKGMISHR